MRDDFLEPERGGGMVGWAIRQLVIWLVGGLAVYWLVANFAMLRPPAAAVAPQAATARVESPPADSPPAETPVLGRAAPAVLNTLALRARPDGHVVVNASVNGATIRFLVDTGATSVALTPADALRAGVAGSLSYSKATSTANGVAKAAPVMLQQIRIGQLEVDNVDGMVMQAEGGISLLGQTFLSRLRSYTMHDGVLTLTWQ
jgi:clan AA aspartic protease (TIGR02281 family)